MQEIHESQRRQKMIDKVTQRGWKWWAALCAMGPRVRGDGPVAPRSDVGGSSVALVAAPLSEPQSLEQQSPIKQPPPQWRHRGRSRQCPSSDSSRKRLSLFFLCRQSFIFCFFGGISFAYKIESRTMRRGGRKLWLFLGNGDFLQGFWTLSAVINNIWEPTDFWDFLDFILYWNRGTILRPVFDIIEVYSVLHCNQSSSERVEKNKCTSPRMKF